MLETFGRRLAQLRTPFGELVTLARMQGREALGRPFEYTLELLSPTDQLDAREILGEAITVELTTEGLPRYFNGHVIRFSYMGLESRFHRYEAVIRPWLWLLSKTTNSRIFQRKSIPDVIYEIFRARGFSDFEGKELKERYGVWEYLTQYRETDFDFVSRLMEQAGIYYYFVHEPGKHTLVLADGTTAHRPAPGHEHVPYYPESETAQREREHVGAFRVSHSLSSGAYETSVFDFEQPRSAAARARLARPMPHAHGTFEIYDHPGKFDRWNGVRARSAAGEAPETEAGAPEREGEALARVQLEAIQVDHAVAEGKANVRALAAGHLFTLTGHPHSAHNKEHMVVGTFIRLENDLPENDLQLSTRPFTCDFRAIDAKLPFRSTWATPRPTIPGPQSAIVVGEEGEEISTDPYGRVKVQFHWDRQGKRDGNSSCWVRVAQSWAGNGWGSMFIPRIGQEVIVEFLDGDPDRPIITGCAYNGANLPPWDLPAAATQSGVRTRSTKGGGVDNFNELRFEDRKGEEEVYLQAERNLKTFVKNDQSLRVKKNRKVEVGRNEAHSVSGTRRLEVTQKNTEIFSDEHDIEVTKKVTEAYKAAHSRTIQGPQIIDLATDRTETIAGTYDLRTNTMFSLTQAASNLTFAGGTVALATGGITITVGPATVSIDDGGKVEISSPSGISLACGPNELILSPSGVEINGTQIALQAGQSQVVLTPAAAELKGPVTNVEARTVCSITGAAMVKMNS